MSASSIETASTGMRGPTFRGRLMYAVAVIIAFTIIKQIRLPLFELEAFARLYRTHPSEVPTIIWKALQIPLCVLAVMALRRTGAGGAFRELGLRAPLLRGLGVALLGTLPVMVGFALVGRLNPRLLPEHLVMTGLASPLSEEVLFRGFLFGQLYQRARWPFWLAVLANAVPFAAGHLYQAEGGDVLMALGILAVTGAGAAYAAWLFLSWNRNLWVPIGFHAFVNASAYLFDAGESALSRPANIFVLLLGVVTMTAVTLLQDRLRRVFGRRPRPGVLLALLTLLALPAASLRAQDGEDLARAIRLFEARENDRARLAFQAIVTAQPRNAEALYYLARTEQRLENPARAATLLEQAIRIDSTTARYHLQLADAYADRAQESNMVVKARLAPKIKRALERAVALDSAGLEGRVGLVRFYSQAPGFLGGSQAKARAELAEVRRRDPYIGALESGRLHERLEDVAGAEREYEAAIRERPDSAGAYYRLAGLHQRAKQPERALATYERLVGVRPDQKPAYLAAGLLHVTAERWERAFAMFEQLLAMDSTDRSALYQFGRTGALSGQRLDRAEAALREYLKHPPERGQPSWAGAHFRLGMIHEKRGELAAARREYETALSLDPNLTDARSALRKLR